MPPQEQKLLKALPLQSSQILDELRYLQLLVCASVLNQAKRTSLLVQWARIHYAIKGTDVQSLVREQRFHMLWSH